MLSNDTHMACHTQRKKGTFARSATVGILATIVDLIMLAVLVECVGLSPAWANVPALVAGLAVQFFGNKFFAFGDRSRAYAKQGSQFVLVELGALVLSGLAFHLAVTLLSVPYALARMACGGLVYVSYSYPLWRLIFRAKTSQQRAKPSIERRSRGGAQCITHYS